MDDNKYAQFSIVVAIDTARGLGRDNTIPWRVSEDQKFFKTLTSTAAPNKQNAVIMGRKTWESLPDKFRPLPNRLNVVLTRQPDYSFPDGVIALNSLQDALTALHPSQTPTIDQVFVIGGAQLYKEAISHPNCDTIYQTVIASDYNCDCHFPPIPFDIYTGTYMSTIHVTDSYTYYFKQFKRKDG